MAHIRELNLELGRPSTAMALDRLEREVDACRRMHTPVMKVIHGYGSSGSGGKIRTAVRKYLKAQTELEQLQYLTGERFSMFEEEARQLMQRFPQLRQDRDREQYNQGITFIFFS